MSLSAKLEKLEGHGEARRATIATPFAKEIEKMNNDIEIQLGRTIHDSIDSMRMFEARREAARDAMRTARLLVDGSMWVKDKIGQLSQLLFVKPQAQH